MAGGKDIQQGDKMTSIAVCSRKAIPKVTAILVMRMLKVSN